MVLVLIPGPDFAVVTKNTLVGGRRRGRWTALGVSSSNLVQGTAAAFGVSGLILRVQPLFEAIKWAGVGYLAYLGAQAIRSALRGQYQPADEADGGGKARGLAGWRQGFTSNITNPKVLVFYLAVLPQFLTPGAGLGWLLVLAWSQMIGFTILAIGIFLATVFHQIGTGDITDGLPNIDSSLMVLMGISQGGYWPDILGNARPEPTSSRWSPSLHGAPRELMRRTVRRGLDAVTGAVLLGVSDQARH